MNWLRKLFLGSLSDDVISHVEIERECPVDWRLSKLQEARLRHGKGFLLDVPVTRKTEPSSLLREIEKKGKVIKFPVRNA